MINQNDLQKYIKKSPDDSFFSFPFKFLCFFVFFLFANSFTFYIANNSYHFDFSTQAFAETITFSADTMQGSAAEDSEYTLLTGRAVITTESMHIESDSIEMSGKDFRIIKATGNIKGSNTKSKFDFTCDTLTYNRDTEVATLQGNVTMDDSQNDVKASAQLIEYNQKTDIAIMQISTELHQKDNVCTASLAVYRKNNKILELSGNPKIVRGDDTFRAQIITLNIDTEEITLDGKVRGSVTDSKE